MPPCPPSVIVLDSTAFGSTPDAQNYLLKQLGEYATRTNSRILVPEVVRKECRARVVEGAIIAHRSLAGSANELRKLGASVEVPELAELERSAIEHWEAGFVQLGAEVIPTPDVPHDEVIDKLHAGHSPFVHKGNRREDGYRDYLVWRSAVDAAAASEDRSAIFISSDQAFAQSKKTYDLAEDLEREATAAGVTIGWRPDFYRFLNEEAQPYVGQHEEALARVTEYVNTDDFREFLLAGEDLRGLRPEAIGFGPEEYGLRYLDDLEVEAVTSAGAIRVEDVVALDEDEWSGRIRVERLGVTVSQFVDADDPPPFDDESWISVDFRGVSKRVARVDIDLRIERATLDVVFEPVGDQIHALSMEIVSADDTYQP